MNTKSTPYKFIGHLLSTDCGLGAEGPLLDDTFLQRTYSLVGVITNNVVISLCVWCCLEIQRGW